MKTFGVTNYRHSQRIAQLEVENCNVPSGLCLNFSQYTSTSLTFQTSISSSWTSWLIENGQKSLFWLFLPIFLPSLVQQFVIVRWSCMLTTIIICHIKHIQQAKFEKINLDFNFENLRKTTKSRAWVPQGASFRFSLLINEWAEIE